MMSLKRRSLSFSSSALPAISDPLRSTRIRHLTAGKSTAATVKRPCRTFEVETVIRRGRSSRKGSAKCGVLYRLRKRGNKKGTSCDIPALNCPI